MCNWANAMRIKGVSDPRSYRTVVRAGEQEAGRRRTEELEIVKRYRWGVMA